MIKITCNRCNKPIESIDKVGFIQFCYHNPFESVTDDNISDRNHYCEDCMAEIEQFIDGKIDFKSEPRTSRYRIDYEKIMSLKESGMKNKDIAAEMGMTSQEVATAVYTYKKRNGKATEPQRKESNPKKQEKPQSQKSEESKEAKRVDTGKILALWNAKWSIGKIAEEMGMEESEVANILTR